MALSESSLDPKQATFDTVLGSGLGFSHLLKRGETFRIVDLEGNQAVDTLFYNADDTHEHYSAQNTLQAQGRIYLTTGSVLVSNRGRPMLRIEARRAPPAGTDDVCRTRCPENARGFSNTERLYA